MMSAQGGSVKKGDQVRVNYVGRFEDGTVFDSSDGNDPLLFIVGEGMVIPGFEQGVIGMTPGEIRTIKVSPEEGYGKHVAEMVAEVERKQIPEDDRLVVGGFLEMTLADGQTLEVQVVELTETMVTLDANHPLAGKALQFEIELIEIV